MQVKSISAREDGQKLLAIYAKVLVAGVVILALSQLTDASICIFYNYTGCPCPSCGMTRAFESLLKLEWAEAFRYHPLFLLVFLFPYIYYKENKLLAFIVISLFIGLWFLRLAGLLPGLYPLPFNQAAGLYRIISWIFCGS